MSKKKAKLIFKHNYFEIVEAGDYVLCAISGKKIELKDLNYWKNDPLWTPNKIKNATKDWFKYIK